MAVGVMVLILLITDFNSRMTELRRLSTERHRVSAQVTNLVQTKAALQTQIEEAKSDAAAIEWAYQEGHMAREGDNLIVPLAPAGSTPEPTPRPVATPQVIENWQVWLSLFADQFTESNTP